MAQQDRSHCGIVGIQKNRNAGQAGERDLYEFESLGVELSIEERRAGDVASGSRETGYDTCLDGIADDGHDNRNRCRGLFGREGLPAFLE
jgi:hypothetical protein